MTTGGTSGNQLRLLLDDGSQSAEMAYMHRQWARVGYSPRSKKATFRGIEFKALPPNVFWQYNSIYNEVQFSPFLMSQVNLDSYLAEFIKYCPSFIHGYPSAIELFADYIISNRLNHLLPQVQGILCGSEALLDSQREKIECAFNARAFSWYGHTERLVLAGECEFNSTYHHFPDYGYLEIVDDGGGICSVEGDVGEIVGTGFNNFSMPLIRYRTGDYATKLSSHCECGRNWDRFSNVDGHRKQEMLVGRNGARFSLAAINVHGKLFECVRRFQYCQYSPGKCTLKIMPGASFTNDHALKIEQSLSLKTGGELDVIVELVDHIPLTPRGKLKMLISELL